MRTPTTSSPRALRAAALGALGALSLACRSEGPKVTLPPQAMRERAAEMRRLSFELEPADKIVLEDFDGDVYVEAARRKRPELLAHLGTISDSIVTARGMLEQIDFEVERDGHELRIRLIRPDSEDEPFLTKSRYDLSVPPGLAVTVDSYRGGVSIRGDFRSVNAATNYGWMVVSGARGLVYLKNGAGDLEVSNVRGPRLDIATEHGDVKVLDYEGEYLRAHSTSGDIQVASVIADRSFVDSTHGSLEVSNVVGTFWAKVGAGSVSLISMRGEKVTVEASQGDIYGRDIEAAVLVRAPSAGAVFEELVGSLDMRTTYGSILASGVLSAVDVSTTSGEVWIEALPGSSTAEPWYLESRYEDVQLIAPKELGFELEARSEYGTVELGFPILVEAGSTIDGTRTRGAVNGGGELVRARTVSGKVRIGPPGSSAFAESEP